MQTISNAIQLSHILIKSVLSRNNVYNIVDATAGNGNDTLFLAQNMQKYTKLYAFDIQESALNSAKKNIQENSMDIANCDNIKFICDSHDRIDAYVLGNIDLAIFNLGYLPGGNHDITTKCETTKKAVQIVLDKLSLNGCLAIVLYSAHEEGLKEANLLREFLENLPKKYFTAGYYQMVNHNINAPALCWIEKVKLRSNN